MECGQGYDPVKALCIFMWQDYAVCAVCDCVVLWKSKDMQGIFCIWLSSATSRTCEYSSTFGYSNGCPADFLSATVKAKNLPTCGWWDITLILCDTLAMPCEHGTVVIYILTVCVYVDSLHGRRRWAVIGGWSGCTYWLQAVCSLLVPAVFTLWFFEL